MRYIKYFESFQELDMNNKESVVEWIDDNLKDVDINDEFYNDRMMEYIRKYKEVIKHDTIEVYRCVMLKNIQDLNTDKVVLSYNLAEMKNKGELKMNKVAKQKFVQIPIVKLIHLIELKCNEVGIKVETINEANTSKCSCLTDDVNNPKDNDLNGDRSKRGLMTDKKLKKRWNADINGAVNHIRKYDPLVDLNYLHTHMYKLCNPIKITNDYDFTKYLQTIN